MGRFDNIKTAIDTNINTNGNQAITGAVMNSVMKQTVDSVDTQLTELESLVGQYVEDAEFVRAYKTEDGKFLFGIKRDGSIEWAVGIPKPIRDRFKSLEDINSATLEEFGGLQKMVKEIGEYGDNLEYLSLVLSDDNRILEALKKNGVKLLPAGLETPFVNTKGAEISSNETQEHVYLVVDTKGRIINAISRDLEKVIYGGVDVGALQKLDAALKQSGILSVFEIKEDIENRKEMVTDSEGRILSYRKPNGTKVENAGFESPAISTGNLKVKSIEQIGLPPVTDKEYIYLERPKFGELRFYGDLPTDESDARTPTNLDFLFKVNDKTLISAKCTLAIQGHGSAAYQKKGYTFEPYNINGDAVEIKFGNMIATDSFHLKAFATDQTHARDVGGGRIWQRLMRALEFPYNKINNIPFEFKKTFKKNIDAIADAQYFTDGFPCVVYVNDEFWGLYTLRLKKSRQNYAMEKSVKSEIFLDATNFNTFDEYGNMLRWSNLGIPFDHRGWDLKNPKLSGYEEGAEITDKDVLSKIERLFTFTSNIDTMHEDYEDYITLKHWLVFVITEELLFSEDSTYNNMNLLTWDGEHWSIFPYDLDLTYGLHAWTKTLYDANKMYGATMLVDNFFPKFKSYFGEEIKSLYTQFRNSGVISEDAIMKIYREQIDSIPRSVYEDDFKKWGSIWENGNTTIEHIHRNVNARIAYLDSLWLNK